MLEGQERGEADAVRLSTLHAAKGLEFAHVFIVGLEEGLLPHREAIASGNIDEERRLMYVGITRAQRSLHLSYCRRRKRAGEAVECQPSRFLGELAQEDLRWAGAPIPADEAAREKVAEASGFATSRRCSRQGSAGNRDRSRRRSAPARAPSRRIDRRTAIGA